jgi:prephenate dehydrogenase
MAVQITIIGLEKIGESVGLALAEHTDQLYRVGYDKDVRLMREVQKRGAIDKSFLNLHAAVEKADIILLATSVEESYETIEIIAQDLQPESVLVDISSARAAIAERAKKLLPSECHFVSVTPAFNPSHLDLEQIGVEEAHADLFHNSLMAISSLAGTHEDAMKLVVDLIYLLGATPFFVDMMEIDGWMAAVDLLPQLSALALVNATIEQPGWRDGRKFAGANYARISGAALDQNERSLSVQSILENKENALRLLDEYAMRVRQIRAQIDANDEAGLGEMLDNAREARLTWWADRKASKWQKREAHQEMPKMGQMLGQMFLGNLFQKRAKKKDD